MADRVDAATRSRIMRAIKRENTTPERNLQAALIKASVGRWHRNGKGLPGTPDFVFMHSMLAVFVHGCFWHLCPKHYKAPAGEGFRAKMDRNRRRDIRVRRQLRAIGWSTLVVWEHEDSDRAAARIQRRLEKIETLKRMKVRLHGRECPEYGGTCKDPDCANHCEKEIPF